MASSFTTSVFQIKATSGTHRVKICTHSLTSGFKSGRSLQCGTFTVGEYQWAIHYYPNGLIETIKDISFYVELRSEAKDVDVFLRFSLVDQNGIASHQKTENMFCTYSRQGDKKGFPFFAERQHLDSLRFVKDDSFTVECSLQILLDPSVEELKINSSISVPPSNMHQHLHHLLQSGEGADISFKVKGETIPAHRIILASRSSVFRAELFGSMSESTASDDYADEGVDEDIMTQHLTVADDRYGLDRLRLICEERLAKKISADNVLTTLALAEQHNCQQLKEICLNYISSSKILHSFTETDVFASLLVSYPTIFKELLEKVDSKRRT